ncbi:hypothetical protein F511_07514 [Dorcoceras hygrometricum]|uniref:Uncharacterized protein n=1 Tax=Dorcoceras hygrometricum TaxID=472368 RepID=A0A2Z7BAX9_9LAMI|nr:hypothetical protein F511_07514 [Dorcoceras hygrometricum]
MVASFFGNTMQVDFASVLAMEHTGLVRMFKSLEEIGLKELLEASGSVYERAMIEFFANAKVTAGTIVSFVANRKMVVTKDVFAEAFGLPIEGMVGFFDIPTPTVVEMRRKFSGTSAVQGTEYEEGMKMECRMLHDIVAKELCAKAGYFDVVGFNPGPIPDIPDGADDGSTAGGPEANVETTPEMEERDDNVSTAADQDEHATDKMEIEGIFAPVEIREINWATYFLPKIDPAAKGKEIMDAFSMLNLVEEHCISVLKSAWEDVSNKMCEYDKWIHFRTAVRLNTVTSMMPIESLAKIEDQFLFWAETELVSELFERRMLVMYKLPQADLDADIKLKEVQKVILSLESKIASMDSRAVSLDSKVDRIMDAQTFMKLDFGLYKRAFYEKMDTLVAKVTSSQTALETSLVRQFTEHQIQISSNLDFFKMQLAEMVNHLKEMGDSKKGEGPSKGAEH